MRTWASIAALGAALLLTGSAYAAPSALAKACAKDVKSVCGNVKPGDGKLAACMKEHFSDRLCQSNGRSYAFGAARADPSGD
jgi:Cysteine rich repeat